MSVTTTPPLAFEPVVVAILAKDKAHVLPLYFECLLQQTFPKACTHLYIRTNDNRDDTEYVLKTFVEKYGSQYASVVFDTSSVSESLLKYQQHEWCAERFRALAEIRQASINHAIAINAHYFVCDCDNFITTDCLMELYTLRFLNAVVAPLLRSSTNYANYHFGVNSSGYYASSAMYYDVLFQKIKGVIDVAVVHCTYFIPANLTAAMTYIDTSDRHEYVVFSEALRQKGIAQLLDTRKIYGYLTFQVTLADFQVEFKSMSKKYLKEEGPSFPFSTARLPDLIVSPQAGFGNRMRAMCGALLLSEKTGITLAHCWYSSEDTAYAASHIKATANLGFEYYFEPTPHFPSLPIFENNDTNKPCIAYTEWMPGNYWHTYQSTAQRRFNASILFPAEKITEKEWLPAIATEPCVLETSHNVMKPHVSRVDISQVYKRFFVPRARFQRLLGHHINAIGCSIRVGGNFQVYFPESVHSAEKIKAVVSLLDEPVVLFSDDIELRNSIRSVLKHPIVPAFESVGVAESQDIAFLEFLTLASCTCIYATKHSSFAEEAANFGNVQYFPL